MAELVLLSDAVFDSVKDMPFSGGVAISGEKIEHVGTKESVRRYIDPYTTVRDFGDKLILPGICDSHAHLESSAKKECALIAKNLDICRSEDECARAVHDFADMHPELKRINGTGWVLSNWRPGAQPPTKASLDKYIPDVPVYLFSADMHTCWINSKAIEECNLARIVEDNPQFPADYAQKDASGRFTGYLKEAIISLVQEFALSYPPAELAECYMEYTKLLNSMGITAMSDVSLSTPNKIFDRYWPLKAMENRGQLTARYYLSVMPHGDAPYTTGQIKDIDKYREFFHSDKLRIAGIKVMLDGIPFTYTAALLDPYSDDSSTKGEFIFPPEVPMKWFKEANRLGYSVRVHCCGDATVRLALDCFEESNLVNDNSYIRNTIEHLDCVSDPDIPRFAELGVIPSMQPAHLIMCKNILAERYGSRVKNEWCFRKLIDAGAKIAIGTDSPVVDVNPYHTIYMAVTRKDLDGTQYGHMTRDQALTLPEALKGYTAVAAFVNGMEHKVGTLEAGKYADIAVADRNLFKVHVDELKDCRNVCTVFNGKIVYEAEI